MEIMPGSLFTDTDSIAYEIQTEEFYKDITLHIQEKFNTSNYPAHHPLGVPTGVNKEIIGMFKDVVEKVWLNSQVFEQNYMPTKWMMEKFQESKMSTKDCYQNNSLQAKYNL